MCRVIPWWDKPTNPIWDNSIFRSPRLARFQRDWIQWNREVELMWLRSSLQKEAWDNQIIDYVLSRWPAARKYDPYYEDPDCPDTTQLEKFYKRYGTQAFKIYGKPESPSDLPTRTLSIFAFRIDWLKTLFA